MSKEQLISLYPETPNVEIVLWIILASVVIALVIIVEIALNHYIGSMGSIGFVSIFVAAIVVIVGLFYSLIASSNFEDDKEKWENEYYPRYLQSIPTETLEFKELAKKEDGSYEVKIKKGKSVFELTVSEVKFVKDKQEIEVSAKFVEGLEEYGVESGYKDVVVSYPAD